MKIENKYLIFGIVIGLLLAVALVAILGLMAVFVGLLGTIEKTGIRIILQGVGIVIIAISIVFVIKDRDKLKVTLELRRKFGCCHNERGCFSCLSSLYPLIGMTSFGLLIAPAPVLVFCLTVVSFFLTVIFALLSSKKGQPKPKIELPWVIILTVCGIAVIYLAQLIS